MNSMCPYCKTDTGGNHEAGCPMMDPDNHSAASTSVPSQPAAPQSMGDYLELSEKEKMRLAQPAAPASDDQAFEKAANNYKYDQGTPPLDAFRDGWLAALAHTRAEMLALAEKWDEQAGFDKAIDPRIAGRTYNITAELRRLAGEGA